MAHLLLIDFEWRTRGPPPWGANNSLYDSAVEALSFHRGPGGSSPFCSRYDVGWIAYRYLLGRGVIFAFNNIDYTIFLTGQLEKHSVGKYRCSFTVAINLFLFRRVFGVHILIFLIYNSLPQETYRVGTKEIFFRSVRHEWMTRQGFILAYVNSTEPKIRAYEKEKKKRTTFNHERLITR